MKTIKIYRTFLEKTEKEKIGEVQSFSDISRTIRDYADENDIKVTQILTNLNTGEKGVATHIIKDNMDLMFISTEEEL